MEVYLEGYEDRVGLAGYTDDDRALFDGFGGIFDLEDTTLRRAMPMSVQHAGILRGCLVQCHRIIVVVVSEHRERSDVA